MSGRYAIGSIAGVPLLGPAGEACRIDVLDGELLRATLVGSSQTALDFTVHTQVSERNLRGARWGVRVAYLPIAKLNSIVAAMEAALMGGNSFAVVMADQSGADLDLADDIDALVVPDFASLGGKYYTRGALSSAVVKDVTIRFVTIHDN